MLSTEGLTGHIVLPSSPGYSTARKNYNGRFDKFPKIIVYCQDTQDVINAILWVRKHQMPFRVRCGGHSYEAYSLISCGLVIDISGLQKLQINEKNGTAHVGAGLRPSALYEILWNQRRVIPAGTCPTVGISGVTLGGGYGLLSRLHGLTCDNLLQLEMVTAQGEVIVADKNQNSDLFWACQGGGDGSFGVVTSYTFRTHPIDNVARYRLTWDFDQLKKVISYWQRWAPYTDARLTSLLAIPSQGQGDIRANGVFVGPVQELRQIMNPVLEMTQPNTVEFYSTTWLDAALHFAGQPVKQEIFKHSSAFLYEPLSEEALDVMDHNLRIAPGTANLISLDALGGKINQVSPNETAFVHRDALFLIQYLSYWCQDSEAEENIQWIENFRNSMLPYTHGAYRNYPDALIPDWPMAYFGENLGRLMKVKRIYDPENLFHFPQSIPTYNPGRGL